MKALTPSFRFQTGSIKSYPIEAVGPSGGIEFRFQTGSIKSRATILTTPSTMKFRFQTGSIKRATGETRWR